jgi:TatD DNase family protein
VNLGCPNFAGHADAAQAMSHGITVCAALHGWAAAVCGMIPRAMWIDTHCHLDAAEFAGDTDAVRERAARAGVVHCVLPAVLPANFDAVRELAHRHGDSYALGIHPLCTGEAGDEDLVLLDRALAEARHDRRLVAVGEIGLDYFVPGLDAARQEHFYREQLALARRHHLPVLLHVRRSADQLLKELRRGPVGGIAHAFNGSAQQANEFVRLGLRLGFGGTVTYERALQIRRLARDLPLDALVLETDAPDIPPRWLYRTAEERAAGRAQGRNEPGELPAIGAVVAGLRGLAPQELATATLRNACAALPRLAALLRD